MANGKKNLDKLAMEFPNASADKTLIPHKDEEGKTFFTPAKEPPKQPTPPDQFEEFAIEGKKIWLKNKVTGEYIWFDTDGKELTGYQLENLNREYALPPDVSSTGAEKDGELQVREIDENNNSPGHPDYKGQVFAISERQNYQDGQAWTKTILKKHELVVRTLRGELKNTKSNSEESGSTKVEEVKEKGNV